VGFQLTNSGLAGSNPRSSTRSRSPPHPGHLRERLRRALCPAGLSKSTFNKFYYPLYPLAGLSSVAIDGSCSVNLDPGQTITVILIYPPIRAATT